MFAYMMPNQIIPDLAASMVAVDRWVMENPVPYYSAMQ